MKYITRDYVIGEVLDTISLMQLNNEWVPDLDHLTIELIAEQFLAEWKEVGDYEADFQRSLLDYLRDEFKCHMEL